MSEGEKKKVEYEMKGIRNKKKNASRRVHTPDPNYKVLMYDIGILLCMNNFLFSASVG